jgi:hypothetical protein
LLTVYERPEPEEPIAAQEDTFRLSGGSVHSC